MSYSYTMKTIHRVCDHCGRKETATTLDEIYDWLAITPWITSRELATSMDKLDIHGWPLARPRNGYCYCSPACVLRAYALENARNTGYPDYRELE